MSYYDEGFCNTETDSEMVGEISYVCHTWTCKKWNDEYDGVCIIKLHNSVFTPPVDQYFFCGVKHETPFYIINNEWDIYDNFTSWCGRVDAPPNENSYFRYNESANTSGDGVLVCDLPTYDNVPYGDTWVEVYNTSNQHLEPPYNRFRKTNLPIFEISNDDFEGFNKYVRSGDDSAAINYDDLHPPKVHIDVWLDGNFPQMYVKATLERGELQDDKEITISIYSNPVLSPTLTLSDTIPLNEMRTYSFDQYGNNNPIIITRYELIGKITSIAGTSSFFVIKANGEVESTTSGIGDRLEIEYHSGKPDDSDYPNDNTNFNTNRTYNNNSGTNTLTKTYELDSVKLKQFGNFMWSSNFKDNVFSLVQSPLENIVSLKAMPLSGMGGNSEVIKVGNVQSEITADVVVNADSKKTTVGEVYIPRIFKNFIDYTQFNIKIYLPYIGFKELDPVAVMDKTLKLYYIWDCVLGNVMAELYLQGNNDAMLLYDCWQGSAGIDIAITSTNRGQIESGYVNNGISAIANLFSGNLAGVGKDVFSGLTQEFHSESNGVGNPSLLGKMDMTARVIIKRPQPFEPLEYGHVKGYPCYQYFTNKNNKGGISQLSGASSDGTPNNLFIKCDNFIVSNIPDALNEEKREIKELMESGVYI